MADIIIKSGVSSKKLILGNTEVKKLLEILNAEIEARGTADAELQAAIDNKADKKTAYDGFEGGDGAFSSEEGTAVGNGAFTTAGGSVGPRTVSNTGGSVGFEADTYKGGSVGSKTFSNSGGSVGERAESHDGGSVGAQAITGDGFAGGYLAQTIDNKGNGIDAIQLGTGTNSTPKTLQVYDYQLMDAEGNIPIERMAKETEAREAKDAELQTAIDAEAQARIDEDASLHDSIAATNINMEMGDRELQAAIDAEAQERAEIDDRLKYYGDKDIVPSPEEYFTVNETGETITGLTDTGKTQTELIIPYRINGNIITTIETGAFYGKSIQTIIIPNSVIDIHGNVFSACYSLNSVNIPNGITKIEAGTFRWCEALTKISIPNTVETIGDMVFSGCTELVSINISKNVTSIGYNAFENCPNLTIYCEQGSYAETYAQERNIPVVYTDIKAETLNKKQDKVTISELADTETALTYDLSVMHNNELRTKSTLANGITFLIPNDVYPDDYVTSLSFSTGGTAPQIGYSATGILNWVGTDCSVSEGKSIFAPKANTRYDIVIYFNGVQFVGLVNGFVPATIANGGTTS